jgi:uncharacterized protein with FMN-binding domain
MRRIVMALFGTMVGTALLVGLKTEKLVTPLGISAATPADPAGAGSDGSAGGAVQPEQSGQPSQSGQTAVPSTSPGPGKATPATAPTKPTTVAKPTTAQTTAAPPASRTITGSSVATVWQGDNYGNMQVKIVVTGTHIDDIVTIAQSNRPKTVSTTLRSQALTAQSANVGNVSGATASSSAYKQSLASAIAKI